MTDSTPLDRMARAIAKAEHPDKPWRYWSAITKRRYYEMARAALDASGKDELVEALKPFAEKAAYADALEADDDDYVECAPFRAGDFRKARAAIAPTQEPEQ